MSEYNEVTSQKRAIVQEHFLRQIWYESDRIVYHNSKNLRVQ